MDLPTVLPRNSQPKSFSIKEDGQYGVSDKLKHGFTSARSELVNSHPLQASETQYKKHLQEMDFSIMKKVQGVHAPLRLMTERRAAAQIKRLPFLPSSNIMLETLEGLDETILCEDILNDPTQPEFMGQPHMVVEQQLGIL